MSAAKDLDAYFRDWEGAAFGYGYGSGEPHTLAALKGFLAAIPERPYNYEVLEGALTAQVAWLLINTLCRADILEYGTSPRFGWLTPRGELLKRYVDAHTVAEMVDVTCDHDEDYVHCYPDHCNCDDAHCANPFWSDTEALRIMRTMAGTPDEHRR